MVKRHKELMEEPARLLQTDAGKKIIDDAKEEIVQTVYQKIMHDIMGFVETYIFGSIKRHLVEPLYKAIPFFCVEVFKIWYDVERKFLFNCESRKAHGEYFN